MQTHWHTIAKVGNFLFSIAVDQSNEDVHFWHKLQREEPALLSDRLMLIIPRGDCTPQQKRTALTWSRERVHCKKKKKKEPCVCSHLSSIRNISLSCSGTSTQHRCSPKSLDSIRQILQKLYSSTVTSFITGIGHVCSASVWWLFYQTS